MIEKLIEHIEQMPLIAVLRGITPDEALGVSDILVRNGFRFLEVTLNSPDWEQSLGLINDRYGDSIVLGAGTVLLPDEVDRVHAAGGKAIVSPNMRVDVIKRSKALGMLSVPGCYTPTECFAALDAGADILKIFPANTLGPEFIKAITAVLPSGTRICPTGGVNAGNMADFLAAGVFALGLGSALYKPGKSQADITAAAGKFISAFRMGCAGP